METQSQTSTPAPEIRDGKLIIDLPGKRHFEIGIDKIEDLLEWDISQHCNNLILSFAQLSAQLLITQEVYPLHNLLGYTPTPDDLYFVSLVAETFNTNKKQSES